MEWRDRALLVEGIVAGGLMALGFATGQSPLLTLATTAAGVGSNWVSSIAERGFQHWLERWLTERGALHQDISCALSRAFQDALRQLEIDWQSQPDYQHLKRNDPDAAERTLAPLRWLREDAGRLLEQPVKLADALKNNEVVSLLRQDEVAVRLSLHSAIRNYLYGHDNALINFVDARLTDEWLLRFDDLLRGTGERETRAWRAFQQLWQMSLSAAVTHMQQDVDEVRSVVYWLREWAEQLEKLPVTQRDPVGEEALLAAIVPRLTNLERYTKRILELVEGSPWTNQDLLEQIRELLHDPDAVRRRRLTRQYADEVRRKYEYWRKRYIALPASSALPEKQDQISDNSDADRTPSYFRPRGFRVIFPEPRTSNYSEDREPKHFDDVRDAVEEAGDAVLLGEPGAGKTTALWRLMLDYADRAADNPETFLPVYVPLGGYDGRSDVLAFVRRQLSEAVIEEDGGELLPLPAHRQLADFLDGELAHRKLAILFDGLNEMPRDHFTFAMGKLEAFRKAYPGNRFLVTCREADYTIGLLPLPEIHVEPLDDRAIQGFIRAYLQSSPEKAERLIIHLQRENRPAWEMSKNPYMLRMVVAIFESQGTLPANRSELFTQFVGALLLREYLTHPDRFWVSQSPLPREAEFDSLAHLAEIWPLLREWESNPDDYELEKESIIQAGLAVTALAHLAYAMSAAGERGTTVSETFLRQHLFNPIQLNSHQVAIDADRLLYLARSASLLERTPEGYRFTHQLLQEYFAALYLTALGPDHPQVLDCMRYSAWDETFVLVAGLMPRTDSLIENLLPVNPYLAARCAGVNPDALSAEVADNLVTVLDRLASDFHYPWREEIISVLGQTRLRPALAALKGFLQKQPKIVRQIAIEALGWLSAQDAIPALIELLGDDDRDVRCAAAWALGQLNAKDATSVLVGWLRDDDEMVRLTAVQVLEELGGHEAIPALIERLRDENEYIRRVAAKTLGIQGGHEAIPALIERLGDEDEWVRQAAARALEKLGGQGVIPILIEWVRSKDKDWDARLAAIWALGELGAREAIPILLEQLADTDWGIHLTAAASLEHLGAREAIPILFEWLADEDAYVRQVASQILGKLGAREAIPTLIELLGNEHKWVRQTAARALGELGAREAIPTLIERLEDKHWFVRLTVVETLGNLGTQEVIPFLTERLKDKYGDVRYAAVQALGVLGAREAIPALIERLGDGHWFVQQTTAEVLEELVTQETIPTLIEQLDNEDWRIRYALAHIIGRLDADEAIPALIVRLEDQNDMVRGAAVQVLGKLKARDAIPALIERLGDKDSHVRQSAAEALGKLGVREAIPDLIERLGDEDWPVRSAVTQALGELDAREAIPVLIERLEDEYWDVRSATVKVLGGLNAREEDISFLLLYLLKNGNEEVSNILLNWPHEIVLPGLDSLRFHPDDWVRGRVLRLYDELLRRTGKPRKGLGTFPPYARRAALKMVIRLAKNCEEKLIRQPFVTHLKAEALRRLGCAAHALDLIISSGNVIQEIVYAQDKSRVLECAKVLLEQALCLHAIGRFKEALNYARQAQEMAINETTLLTECAAVFEQLGEAEAEDVYTRVINNGNWAGYWRNRAEYYIKQGRYDEAETDILRSVEAEPWHPDTIGLQGRLSLVRGQFIQAVRAFDEATLRDPNAVVWQYCLAFAYLGQKQHQQAMTHLEQAIDRTELHEEVEAALMNLELLARAVPNLGEIEIARERILERKEHLDQLAREECYQE